MLLRIFLFIYFLSFSFSSLSAYDATYYAKSFEGKRTANGSVFSHSGYSAAICDLPLGQYAYVASSLTGVVVTLNDRPNCRKNSQVLDLTERAFSLFAPLSRGRLSDLQVTPIGTSSFTVPKKDFPRGVFASLGIELFTPLSNTYFAGDQIILEGRVTLKKQSALIYLQNVETDVEMTHLISTDDSGYFRTILTLPKESGKYAFIIAGGNGFSSVIPETLLLIERSALTYPSFLSGSFGAIKIRPEYFANSQSPMIGLPEKTYGTLELTQSGKTHYLSGVGFDLSQVGLFPGSVDMSLSLKKLSTPSTLDQSLDYGRVWTGRVQLDYLSNTEGREKIILRQNRKSVTFRFRLPEGTHLLSRYYVTYPSGDVRDFTFPKEFTSENGYLTSSSGWVSGTILLSSNGIYKLEINTNEGIAYINIPIVQGNIWQVIDPLSPTEKYTQRTVISRVQVYVLSRINLLRTQLNRTELVLDPTLMKIAMLKAQDMYKRQYFGHQDPDGNYITEFARKRGFQTSGLGENIASGYNVSDRFLQFGLEESPGHRANMIDPSYKKVGIGYHLSDKQVYLVHVFSRD